MKFAAMASVSAPFARSQARRPAEGSLANARATVPLGAWKQQDEIWNPHRRARDGTSSARPRSASSGANTYVSEHSTSTLRSSATCSSSRWYSPAWKSAGGPPRAEPIPEDDARARASAVASTPPPSPPSPTARVRSTVAPEYPVKVVPFSNRAGPTCTPHLTRRPRNRTVPSCITVPVFGCSSSSAGHSAASRCRCASRANATASVAEWKAHIHASPSVAERYPPEAERAFRSARSCSFIATCMTVDGSSSQSRVEPLTSV